MITQFNRILKYGIIHELTVSAYGLVTSEFLNYPRNVAAFVGDTVQFPCSYDSSYSEEYLRYDILHEKLVGWDNIFSEKRGQIEPPYDNSYYVANESHTNNFVLLINSTLPFNAALHRCLLYISDQRRAAFVSLLGNNLRLLL